jgi:PAS domain S-box-containing protein
VRNLRGWENLLDRFTKVQNELQAFFPIVPHYLCILETIESCANVSENWESLLGWSREVLESRPWIQWLDSSSVSLWRDRLQSLRDQSDPKAICTFQNALRHQDGSWRLLSWRISQGSDRRFYAVAEAIDDVPNQAAPRSDRDPPVVSLKKGEARSINFSGEDPPPVPLKKGEARSINFSGEDPPPVPLKKGEARSINFSGEDPPPVPLKKGEARSINFSGEDPPPVPLKKGEARSINFSGEDPPPVPLKKGEARSINFSGDRWRSLIEHSTTLTWIQDVNGQILYISPAVKDMLGYHPENLIGKSIWDFIHAEDIVQVKARVQKLLKVPSQPITLEYRWRHQDGAWTFLHSTTQNLLHDLSIQGLFSNSYDISTLKNSEIASQQLNEELEQRVTMRTAELKKANQKLASEITDRKQAQLELQSSEEQWRQMINKIADGVLILSPDGIVLFVNSAVESLFDLNHEELLNLHLGIPNSANEICEIYLPKKNGTYITVEMRIEQIDWQDQPAYLASLRDISDRQQAEVRVRESEERYRTLAESSQDLIFILNCDRTLAYVNSFGAKLLEIESETMVGRPNPYHNIADPSINPVIIVDQFKYLESKIQELFYLNSSIRLEDQMLYQGSQLWLDTFLVPLRDEFGKISQILGVARDITKIKWIEQSLRKTQSQLRQREKLLRLTLEQAPIGIVTCDLSGKFIHFNPAFCQILRYSARTLKQMAWHDITDQDHLKHQKKYYEKLLQGDIRNFQLENSYYRQDGSKIQGVIRVALIRDSQGSPLQYVAQLEDVTERKQAEAKLQASLKEKEVLLKEIHHRVKNNLQIVSSLLDLQAEYIQNPQVLEKLEDSKHRLLAMSLIHETLYQSENLAQVDLSDYVERLATNILFAQSTDYERIRLQFELEPVFLNLETAIPCGLLLNELITNSIKHAFPEPMKGKITIGLYHQSSQPTSRMTEKGCQVDKIMLRVSDNGVGLPKHINFKDTKSLGLTLIQDLTQQLRGDLEISSIKGTEFSLTFSELNYRQRI